MLNSSTTHRTRAYGASAGPRLFVPLCRRCGRRVSPATPSRRDPIPMCSPCAHADRSRYHGQPAVNFSPFRPLGASRPPSASAC